MEWSIYLVIYLFGHFCLTNSVKFLEVTKCYGDFFKEALCPSGLTITVQGAVFGVSTCNIDARKCCPLSTDCVLDSQQTEPAYYRAIQRACNGRRTCGENIRADWTSARSCDPLVPTTDYVTLFYTCSASGERAPPHFLPSTTVPSLISSLSTIFATEFPEGMGGISSSSDKTDSSMDAGKLAGIIVAAFTGLLFLILIAVYCIRTKEPAWAETLKNGGEDSKSKKDIQYLTSKDSSQKGKGLIVDSVGALNLGFSPERETPRYIRPSQPPPVVNQPYYTGAEVVRTPQQAIRMMDTYKDEEDQYDVIDDVISRFTPSTGSMKKKSIRTLSVPVPRVKIDDGRQSLRKTNSHTGIEKVTINDQIYYSPISPNQALPPKPLKAAGSQARIARLAKKPASFGPADEAYYNGTESIASVSQGVFKNEQTYQGLALRPGLHSYETVSPSPQAGRSLTSGNTIYSLVTDPENDLYYSDVIAGVHTFNHDENPYSDVEL